MLFHDKLDIKLIRLVRDNPVLYDHNNAKYMDFNMREVTWQKIGDELKRSAADCKVRWINIRDVYRRILRKNLVPGQRPKMYKYENEISFLRPFYKDVILQNEEFESDERSNDHGNEDCGDEVAINSDNSDEPIKKSKLKSYYKSSVKKKKKRRTYEEVIDPMSTPTPNDPPIPSEFDSTDPVDAFLLSIGATLKTFSPYHLNLAKSKIFSVVQEHDLQQIVQKQQHNETTPHDIKISTSESIYMQ
ncbi:uncharacterized protein LOC123666541 [Melitaea cinxia]|uniref:uncharacterized protein LOC123666541 n=1 Tax=Melitaea cinxia TaxID=113334 RepID=UPI001E2737FD|nr:uncharacterized protein LOC123666541 [Melitaea cinxia]